MHQTCTVELEAAPAARTPSVSRLLTLHARFSGKQMEHVCLTALWLAVLLYILAFLRLTFRLYDHFTIMAYDLGIFDQAAWLISHGLTPFVTVRGLPILADHFSALLYLLIPLYALFPSAKTLLFTQTVALAAGALPIYALGRDRQIRPPYALLLAVAYLLFPPMQWTNAFEFHPEAFATPLLLAAFLFMTRRRWPLYFVMLTLAAMSKENAGLTILCLGLYTFLKINRRMGAWTVVLGAVAMAAAIVTVRAFNHGAPSPFFELYSRLGGSPTQIALFVLRHPLAIGATLVNPINRHYLYLYFFPFLFLTLLAPEILLIAMPALLTNMLSNRLVMHTIGHQYTAFITPFLFIALVYGFDRARRWGSQRTLWLMSAYIGLSIAFGWGQSPLVVWGRPIRPGLSARQVPEVHRMLSLIPPQATVSAQGTLMGHLTHRRFVYPFPNPFIPVASGYGTRALRQMELKDYTPFSMLQQRQAFETAPVEYIALCPSTTVYPLEVALYKQYAVAALQSRAYGIVAIGKYAVLLRRGADHDQGLRLLEQQAKKKIQTDEDVKEAFRLWTSDVSMSV